MGDSSDSEEFYDAQEFTPIKGSKRSSLCRNVTPEASENKFSTAGITHSSSISQAASEISEDDRNTVTNLVQDRRRFQQLRRCMQIEDDDESPMENPTSFDRQSQFSMEHPFKIIEHDTMSMTSLGRIGRIFSGAAESHPNIRENLPSSSVELSTVSDDPLETVNRAQNVLAMAEPDVIASTKANSLKHTRGLVTVTSGEPRAPAAGPVAPPRRKKRHKLHGSQTLSTTDGDNLSVCTTDTDDYRHDKPPPLQSLTLEPSLSDFLGSSQSNALPSPASTIESLTRELQDSLELSQTTYGQFVVKPQDEERARGSNGGEPRTLSEGRAAIVGHSSLGSTRGVGARARSSSAARRRSAGDEQLAPGAGSASASASASALRARAASGQRLSDIEILERVTVLNLDTGERVPLSVAEHKLPQCINPLSLHIMRLTSEYVGPDHDDENTSISPKPTWKERISTRLKGSAKSKTRAIPYTVSELNLNDNCFRETDEEGEAAGAPPAAPAAPRAPAAAALRKKTDKLKRFLGSTVRRTVEAARSLAQEVSQARHKEDVAELADAGPPGAEPARLRASASHRGPYDFDGCVRHVQEMSGEHTGAVWCCRFSVCGRLLATAGQDRVLRVWVTRDASHMFHEMRTKYNAEQKSSPTPSQECVAGAGAGAGAGPGEAGPPAALPPAAPFCPQPFCVYSGHTSDLLDVSWSKNYFILSSSMDKTVRLWHISRGECLCCFQHIDFVTAIVFHPRDDRYFLSGSLDGKLRLWNIPDKKVAVWNEVDGKTNLITAANFCQNGKFAVVGTYDGRCIFYTTDQLKYHTQIEVKSTRGKNSIGRKISGIEPMPNDDKILVTSNDSRIRLYDLRDLNLSCKYKGYVNISSQIKASFSHDGKYIVSGSENQCIYIWKTYHDYSKFTSVRRDRNDFWEGIKAHNAVVTCAVFASNPDYMIKMIAERESEAKLASGEAGDGVKNEEAKAGLPQTGHVLVSADFNGCIKVFVHKAKPKHSSLPASALA